jgi:6-phosphogluconate dehydrogenase
MGGNMAERLKRDGHDVVGYDRDTPPSMVASLAELVERLAAPRVVWLMVPAGEPTESTLRELTTLLSPGDLIIDGGNSYFRDSLRRAAAVEAKGLRFMDIGTSGGIWGLSEGYCLMAGGTPEAFAMIEPALKSLAPPEGYLHAGPAGAGHFTKMVHNGIEYALMQAYAEGFQILETSQFEIDLPKVAALWNRGSVVRSWLLELTQDALAEDPKLEALKGYVEDSGEGRWTVFEAINQAVPAPTIALSLFARFASRQEDSFANRLLAAMRNKFGGHAVRRAEKG